MTKDLKCLLNEKKRAFLAKDRIRLNCVQKENNAKIRQCKEEFKSKVEAEFRRNNSRKAWQGVKTMIGSTKARETIPLSETSFFVNELNEFYSRFDKNDFSKELHEFLNELQS